MGPIASSMMVTVSGMVGVGGVGVGGVGVGGVGVGGVGVGGVGVGGVGRWVHTGVELVP